MAPVVMLMVSHQHEESCLQKVIMLYSKCLDLTIAGSVLNGTTYDGKN